MGYGFAPWRRRARRGMGSRFGRRRIGLKLRSAPFAVRPDRHIVGHLLRRVLPSLRFSTFLRGYDRAAIMTRSDGSLTRRGPAVRNSPHRLPHRVEHAFRSPASFQTASGVSQTTAPQDEPRRYRAFLGCRDPDSNWGHHDFQSLAGAGQKICEARTFSIRPSLPAPCGSRRTRFRRGGSWASPPMWRASPCLALQHATWPSSAQATTSPGSRGRIGVALGARLER